MVFPAVRFIKYNFQQDNLGNLVAYVLYISGILKHVIPLHVTAQVVMSCCPRENFKHAGFLIDKPIDNSLKNLNAGTKNQLLRFHFMSFKPSTFMLLFCHVVSKESMSNSKGAEI